MSEGGRERERERERERRREFLTPEKVIVKIYYLLTGFFVQPHLSHTLNGGRINFNYLSI